MWIQKYDEELGAAEATYQEELAQTNQVNLVLSSSKCTSLQCHSCIFSHFISQAFGCALLNVYPIVHFHLSISNALFRLQQQCSSSCVLETARLSTCVVNGMLQLSLQLTQQMAWYGTAQHSTAQHSTAQHSTPAVQPCSNHKACKRLVRHASAATAWV